MALTVRDISASGLPAFDGHERVVFADDPANGLYAIVAIHHTGRGPAFGGARMRPYRDVHQALDDALRLSRAMTYKSAICELPFGGGKAVIVGNPGTDKTRALLHAMGRAVNALGGAYLVAEDLGTSLRDMAVMREVSPHVRGVADEAGAATPATAYGVLKALEAAVAHRFGARGLDGVTVAVQGLGNVGARLCGYLAEAGARLVVADVDELAVARLRAAVPVRVVAPDAIASTRADVFAPCALGGVIDAAAVARLGAPVVVGAANNQLAAPEVADRLAEAGVLWVPDYLANAGGVIDVAHEGPGYDPRMVLEACERLFEITTDVLLRAEAEGAAPARVADRLAEQRFSRTPRRRVA
jgi:leucine dehydrogenase